MKRRFVSYQYFKEKLKGVKEVLKAGSLKEVFEIRMNLHHTVRMIADEDGQGMQLAKMF